MSLKVYGIHHQHLNICHFAVVIFVLKRDKPAALDISKATAKFEFLHHSEEKNVNQQKFICSHCGEAEKSVTFPKKKNND